ncbi:MAG: hypothetical protein JWM53_12, partial [bacterium]|nr:hypothetical protein [bacterium]
MRAGRALIRRALATLALVGGCYQAPIEVPRSTCVDDERVRVAFVPPDAGPGDRPWPCVGARVGDGGVADCIAVDETRHPDGTTTSR